MNSKYKSVHGSRTNSHCEQKKKTFVACGGGADAPILPPLPMGLVRLVCQWRKLIVFNSVTVARDRPERTGGTHHVSAKECPLAIFIAMKKHVATRDRSVIMISIT